VTVIEFMSPMDEKNPSSWSKNDIPDALWYKRTETKNF
jgi:hypothetical protein